MGAGSVVQQCVHMGAQQGFLGVAHQVTKRLIGLLDLPTLVARHQYVRHRRQQAVDELLGRFELRVLLLQRHFVVQQLGVDVVHLLDNVQPGVVAYAGWRCALDAVHFGASHAASIRVNAPCRPCKGRKSARCAAPPLESFRPAVRAHLPGRLRAHRGCHGGHAEKSSSWLGR